MRVGFGRHDGIWPNKTYIPRCSRLTTINCSETILLQVHTSLLSVNIHRANIRFPVIRSRDENSETSQLLRDPTTRSTWWFLPQKDWLVLPTVLYWNIAATCTKSDRAVHILLLHQLSEHTARWTGTRTQQLMLWKSWVGRWAAVEMEVYRTGRCRIMHRATSLPHSCACWLLRLPFSPVCDWYEPWSDQSSDFGVWDGGRWGDDEWGATTEVWATR